MPKSHRPYSPEFRQRIVELVRVAKLLRELPPIAGVSESLIDQARVLDAFYIPTRYPHSHPEGAPHEHYGALQSEEAIGYAGAIIAFVRSRLA